MLNVILHIEAGTWQLGTSFNFFLLKSKQGYKRLKTTRGAQMEDETCNAKRNAMSLVKIQNSIKIKIVMPAVASRVYDGIL